MTASSRIHPLHTRGDRQWGGSLSVRRIILHLSSLLSSWTMDRALSEILLTPKTSWTQRTSLQWSTGGRLSQFDDVFCKKNVMTAKFL